MKKRLKKKLMRNTNMKRHKHIFNQIEKHFKIKNVQFGNGYFLFNFGEKSVCHFDLKEVKDWEFGIWLSNNSFDIFGEHVELIDKFKPSRTYISFRGDVKGFIDLVKKIQLNPELYFVDSLTGDALTDYKETVNDDGSTFVTGYQVVRFKNESDNKWYPKRDETITQESFVKAKYDKFYQEKKEEETNVESDKKYAFDLFKQLPTMYENILAVGIEDKNVNRNGWVCSPRYSVNLIVSKDLSDEAVHLLDEEVSDFLRKKNYDSKIKKTYEHQFRLDNIYDDESILKEMHYQYKKGA